MQTQPIRIIILSGFLPAPRMSPLRDAAALQANAPARVPINTATADELTALYGIGPALAARIVRFRGRNGPLRGPGDLARVDGLGQELAYVLAPHIDWQEPLPADEERWKARPSTLLMLIISSAGMSALSLLSVQGLFRMIRTRPDGWMIRSWGEGISCVSFALLAASTITMLRVPYARSERRSWQLWQAGVRLAIAGTIGVISFGIALLAWAVISPRFSLPPHAFAGTLVPLLGAVVLLHDGRLGIRPTFISDRLLAALARATDLLTAPAAAVGVWVLSRELPWWMGFYTVPVGGYMMWSGLRILRTATGLGVSGRNVGATRPDMPEQTWMRWINERVPDPRQQKELLDALQGAHPPSRWRTLRGLVITGAGTWLLSATAGAVWEWVVQNWLEGGFGGP